jgi:hypothetical protein
MPRIFVGADDGLHVFEDGRAGELAHPGRRVTALGREDMEMWAILDDHEVWHTAAMDWWFHVATLEELRGNCIADTVAGVLVGTSHAHLLRVSGPGVERVDAFDEAPGRDGWYTPWGGPPDTRSIAENDGVVFANVHVGGIVRSRDRGDTWEPTIDVDADVHRVWVDVRGVYAACARGLAVSRDSGETWTVESDGLHAPYSRGVTMCGDTVLVTASTGPHGGRAAIYRASSGGGPFERCRRGLPEWFDDNIDSSWLDAMPELAAFASSDGRVFASSDEGASWDEVASGLPSIGCVQVMP